MLIYADFNGLEESRASPDEVYLDLTGYGTLSSLSLHQVCLYVGQQLLLGDPDGLQVKGDICFDPARKATNNSGWYAKFKRHDIQDCEPLEHDYATHLCFTCRKNLEPYLNTRERHYNEYCPYRGTPVMFPMLPPAC